MLVVKLEFAKVLLNLLENVADQANGPKYSLQFVQIRLKGSLVQLTATDGVGLATVHRNPEEIIKWEGPKVFLVSQTAAKRLKQDVKNKSQSIVIEKEDICTDTDMFPKWEQIVPKYMKEDKASITFNVEFLHDLLKGMREDKRERSVTITFNAKDPLKPIVIRRNGNGSTADFGLLMPIRK